MYSGVEISRRRITVPTFCGINSRLFETIIDVGANQGQFARRARALFPTAQIFCFEPLPEPFSVLRKLAQIDHRIEPFQLALGNEKGIASFHLHSDHSPSSSFLKSTEVCHTAYPQTENQETVGVALTTLDDWYTPRQCMLKPELLIKLDVQGYEDRVIEGGKAAFEAP